MENIDDLIRQYYGKMEEPKPSLTKLRKELEQHIKNVKELLEEKNCKLSDDSNKE